MQVADAGVAGEVKATAVFNGEAEAPETTANENEETTTSEEEENKITENLSAKVQATNFYIDTDEIYALIESAVETANRVGQSSAYLQGEISKLNPVTQQYAISTYKIEDKITEADQLRQDIVDYLTWVDEATKEVVNDDQNLAGNNNENNNSTYTPGTYTPGSYTPGGNNNNGGGSGGGGGGGGGYKYTPTTYTPYKYTPASYTPFKYSPSSYSPYQYTQTTYTPYKYSPSSYSPYSYSPSRYTPYSYSPSRYTPYSYSPSVYDPTRYTPGGYNSLGATLSTVGGNGSYGSGGYGSGLGSGAGGLGGNLAGTGDMNPEDAAALASLAGSSLLSVLANGTPKLASKLSPQSTGAAGQKNYAKKTLAGAGFALGAASIAGGIYLGSKSGYYIFTPEDWEETEEDVQNAIINDFIDAGMKPEEIDAFKESSYRIKASELNEHVKKIEKAFSIDEAVADEIINMYHFSLFDDNDDIDRYLLFLIMAIDGKNESADVNIYNILNPYFEEEDIDFIYTGINLEDYVYVEDEEEEETEEDDIEVGQIEEE